MLMMVSTSAATDTPLSASVLTETAADPATTGHHSRGETVISVKEEGNTTVTTSVVTTDSLEDAKTSAVKEGVEVEETAPQTHTSLEVLLPDNHAQSKRLTRLFLIIRRQRKPQKDVLAGI